MNRRLLVIIRPIFILVFSGVLFTVSFTIPKVNPAIAQDSKSSLVLHCFMPFCSQVTFFQYSEHSKHFLLNKAGSTRCWLIDESPFYWSLYKVECRSSFMPKHSCGTNGQVNKTFHLPCLSMALEYSLLLPDGGLIWVTSFVYIRFIWCIWGDHWLCQLDRNISRVNISRLLKVLLWCLINALLILTFILYF